MQQPSKLIVSVVARIKGKEWFLIPDQELREAVQSVLQDESLDEYMRSVFPLLSEQTAVQPVFENRFIELLFKGIDKADRTELLRLFVFPGKHSEYRSIMRRAWPDPTWQRQAA